MLVAHMATTNESRAISFVGSMLCQTGEEISIEIVCMCVPGLMHHQIMNYHANFIGKHGSCPFSSV